MAPPVKDPWARREAWRYQGPFTARARYGAALPGLGLGVGAFIVYLGIEYAMASMADGKDHH